MEVTRYIFQSPYSNQVQIGKPDVTSQKGVDVESFEAKEIKIPVSNQNSVDTQNNAKSETIPKIEVNLDMYV